jgi:hypothetical protein
MEIQIRQHKVGLSEPYTEGQTITRAEAQALNSARAEYIRNTLTKWLAKEVPAGSFASEAQERTLRSEAARLDETFQFKLRGLAKPKRGTFEYEAELIAAERIEEELRRGRAKIGTEEFEARVNELAQDSEVIAEAKERIRIRIDVAREGLEALIGD